MLKVNYP